MDSATTQEARPSRITEVMAYVQGCMARGSLDAGARLPSVRRCADILRVSKSTVVEAYERLAAEGEITARRGSGFYAARRSHPLTAGEAGASVEREIDPLWVMRSSLETGDDGLKPGCGWLPESWMPVDAIRRALRAETRGEVAPLVAYGRPLGCKGFRDFLARRLAEREIPAATDQVLLTDSGTQAIDLLCRLLVRPGDAVLVDDPCYFNFLNILRVHGAKVVGVPYTPSGPDLDAFDRAARAHGPRLYLTTAALHNPTGASPSPTVQHRLLKLIQAHDVIAVEDDVFADFEPEPTPRLAAFDGLERVAHVGSCSKTLSASLRCGFIAARPGWIEPLANLKLAATFGSNDLSARVVHRLLVDGGHRRHVEATRTRLARARGRVRAELVRTGLTLWVEPRGGLFLWARLPDGLDAADVSRRAMRDGVVLAPGNVFSIGRGAGSFLRFNVAQCASPHIFEVLRDAMREAARANRRIEELSPAEGRPTRGVAQPFASELDPRAHDEGFRAPGEG